ncbi:MAG: acyl-CoA dehydrogenase family protein [Actinomycetota bacterium]
MAWPFSDEHEELRRSIRAFVESELAPNADKWEAEGDFPDWVFSRLGELGFLGLSYPEQYGGGGGDYLCQIVLAEEMAGCLSGGIAMAVAVQTDMAVPPIHKFGTEEQKQRYLVPALRGEKIFCLGITEPDAGSDVQSISTTAKKVDGGWLIHGRKIFITNGRRAHAMTLVAKTDRDAGHQGISLFVVDTDTPGFEVARTLDKVGMRTSDTAEITFTDMFVPDDALLGKEGEGFYNISWELQGERLVGAAGTIAGARRQFEAALGYAKERKTFGKPIGKHQVIRHYLAEMATEIEAAQQLVYHAAVKVAEGGYPVREISMAKLLTGEVAWKVADKALQIFGGFGYSMESTIQRAWRDTRLIRIGGGTDEVMREIIDKLEGEPTEPERPKDLFTEEHEALRASVRAFVEKEIVPNSQRWEAEEAFPRELFQRVGELGFFGMKFPEEVGGSGPDPVADAVVTEELARCGSGGTSASLGAHKDLASLYVYNFGTAEQHERWLRPSIEGRAVGALGITEPDAGSDVAALRTRAKRDGDDWIINGTKTFITNGEWCDYVVVAAKTDPGAGHSGLTLFVVDRGTPGFESNKLRMLGWRASNTGELSFSDVRVPDANRLGEVGGGFYAIMRNFAWERLCMSLGAMSGAVRTYEVAKRYANERQAFGRPVAAFQVWRHRFADMATKIEAGRALTYSLLRLYAQGEEPLREVAMAKLFTNDLAFHVADECVQVHGGYGYMMEFPAQRAWRDTRLGPIGGGTSEIMKEIIGRSYGL